jgi:hypothetical protein
MPNQPEFMDDIEDRSVQLEGEGVEMPGFSWNARDLIIQSVDSLPSFQCGIQEIPS